MLCNNIYNNLDSLLQKKQPKLESKRYSKWDSEAGDCGVILRCIECCSVDETEFPSWDFLSDLFSFTPDHGSSSCGEDNSVLPYHGEVTKANPAGEIPAPFGFPVLFYLLVQVQAGV